MAKKITATRKVKAQKKQQSKCIKKGNAKVMKKAKHDPQYSIDEKDMVSLPAIDMSQPEKKITK